MFEFVLLNDRKEFVETCAAWDFAEWGCLMPQSSLLKTIDSFKKFAEKNQSSLVSVACVEGKPAGMVMLADEDHPEYRHLSPWLSTLFVHPRFRQQGIGKALCARVIEQAAEIGFQDLHLYTATAEGLYCKMGWKPMRIVKGPTGLDETLMVRSTNP